LSFWGWPSGPGLVLRDEIAVLSAGAAVVATIVSRNRMGSCGTPGNTTIPQRGARPMRYFLHVFGK
jgi:hypothetical protein